MTNSRRGARRSQNGSECVARSQRVPTEKHHTSESDILAAVSSLYIDQMKPFSRLLRKRLGEQATARGGEAKSCGAQALREVCLGSSCFRVESEDGGEWSVTLASKAGSFIDCHDPEDKYPADMWKAFEAYLTQMVGDGDACLSGGRYGSARELIKRQLPFFAGFTLGQICHIIELAVHRQLLGYHNGNIVPYEQSTSMLKSKCALECRSLKGGSDGLPDVAVDWKTAQDKLREILDEAIRRGSNQVPLSNVKRLFRSLYSLNLSETALGYSRLTDLLQDSHFVGICRVELQERGYAVLPVSCDADSTHDGQESTPSEDIVYSSSMSSDDLEEHLDRVKFCPDEPLCLDEFHNTEELAASPWYPFPMMTPSPSPRCVSSHFDAGRNAWETTCRALGLSLQEATIAENIVCQSESDDGETLPRARFCSSEPLCIEEAGLAEVAKTPSCLFPLMTPSPQTPCMRRHPWCSAATDPASSFAPCVLAKDVSCGSNVADGGMPFCSFSDFHSSLPPRQFGFEFVPQQSTRSAEVPVLRIAAFV